MFDLTNIKTELLSKEQIEALLPELDNLIVWAKAVQDHALKQALEGVNYNGFKLVEGRSNRKFSDTEAVADILIGEGYDESEIYERKLHTLTKIEALVGKYKLPELLGSLLEKPQGRPTLVPADDKRKAYRPSDGAIADFSD